MKSYEEIDNAFLDLWYEESPQTYEEIWWDGCSSGYMTDQCAIQFPRLYKSLIDKLNERLEK